MATAPLRRIEHVYPIETIGRLSKDRRTGLHRLRWERQCRLTLECGHTAIRTGTERTFVVRMNKGGGVRCQGCQPQEEE